MARGAVVGPVLLLLVLGAAGCDAAGDGGSQPDASESEPAQALDRELRDELLGMARRDQAERTGGPMGEGDEARTERMKEILDEHGWPTFDLVGRKAEDAAWVIVQHSDLDPEFQREALELLRAAVEEGQASPGNLAYLEDRVAAGAGEPQTYGTQVACVKGGPEPATPIRDRATLDERRAEAGLDPYAAYLREMAEICADVE